MATILFTPFPARGHVNAAQKLVGALRSRGHRVVYASPVDTRELLPKEESDYLPILEQQLPEGSCAPAAAAPTFRERLSKLRTLARRSNEALQAMAEGALDSLFDRVRPDLLICDPMLPHPLLVARSRGVPTLIFNTTLPQGLIYPFLNEPRTQLSWRLRAGALRAGLSVASKLGVAPRMIPLNEQIARRYGYPVDALGIGPEYLIRDMPEMILAPREFVAPQGGMDPRYLFVAPSIDLERSEPDFPWERLAVDKPLIVFSLGSMGGYNRSVEQHLLDTMLAVARARPEWQFVFAVNPSHETTHLDGAAPNVVAVKYAPLLKLLRRAAAAITHAGINTVKECIHFGVPMLLVPLAYDQPAAARLVEQRGLGIVCSPRGLKPPQVLRQLDRLLGEPSWRTAMASMQAVFHQSEQDNSAADAVERLLQARGA